MAELALPAHGGNLAWAQAIFGGKAADWLDLSTGISPWPRPVPAVPAAVWQRLPDIDDAALRQAAAEYYGCAMRHLLPVPGSQFAIGHLPHVLRRGVAALPHPGYREHALAWAAAGHRVVEYRHPAELDEFISRGEISHAVVINPNNPSGQRIERGLLLRWREHLERLGGILVVDEAFADTEPQLSLAPCVPLPNLVILRSVGKFFGLAGIRLGFVLAEAAILAALAPWCGPWHINHPAQWIGEQLFRDREWQDQQRLRVTQQSAHMHELLRAWFPTASAINAGLFLTVEDQAGPLYRRFLQFAEARVLVRYGRNGDGTEWLRFGLPGDQFALLHQRVTHIFGTTHEKT